MQKTFNHCAMILPIESKTYMIDLPLANDRDARILGRYLETASFNNIYERNRLQYEYDSYWMQRDTERLFGLIRDGG